MQDVERDAIVIGGGVNGLVCAARLARAGRRTLLLEARDEVGGGAATREIAPGFRAPVFAHRTGPLRRDVTAALQLEAHGLRYCAGPAAMAALRPGGGALAIYRDPARTAASLRDHAPEDVEAWPLFVRRRAALGAVLAVLFDGPPPPVDAPRARDLWQLLRTLRRFRALPREDAYRLLRWAPMAAADLVSECFESELLRAAVAGDGIAGTMFGPWSAGSGLVLLLRAANEALAAPATDFVAGGPGALAAALAAAFRRAGGEIRTGAPVARLLVDEEARAHGVVLADGQILRAATVVSALDPKRTLLDLCEPDYLPAELLWRLRHYRAHGALAKVNLALSDLPSFPGVDRDALTGLVRVGPDLDALERAFDHAKYGRPSPVPWIEFTIPTLIDPSLAPAGAHVLSAYVQFAPYALREGGWDAARAGLERAVLGLLDDHAPGLRARVVAAETVTPVDLECQLGLTGGHVFHGELALDQLFTMRPLLGLGRYRTPVEGLFLCGSGTHPGTGMTAGSGWLAAQEILRAAMPGRSR